MTNPIEHLSPRRRARLLRALVASGPFSLPVAVRVVPFDTAPTARPEVTVETGTMFATVGTRRWICNASAAAIALLGIDGSDLQADLESAYGGPVDPAMVDLGRARLATIGLVPD